MKSSRNWIRSCREQFSATKHFRWNYKIEEVRLCLSLRRGFLMTSDGFFRTAFGNTIRAFEVYSRVMYGLESIQGWARLLAVIPKDYRELVDETAMQMNFWVNLWAVSILLIAEYAGVAVYTGELRISFVSLGALAVAWIASRMARNAASEWGEWVKASCDVFLPELRARLGFLTPETREQERELWTGFSQAIIYRLPSSLMAVQNKWHAKKDDGPAMA